MELPGKSHSSGRFGGTPILGNLRIPNRKIMVKSWFHELYGWVKVSRERDGKGTLLSISFLDLWQQQSQSLLLPNCLFFLVFPRHHSNHFCFFFYRVEISLHCSDYSHRSMGVCGCFRSIDKVTFWIYIFQLFLVHKRVYFRQASISLCIYMYSICIYNIQIDFILW